MKPVCQFFQQGKCRYGNRCKYDHVRFSTIVDPPQWIFSCFKGLDMTEISPDEVRFSLMCSDTREVLDSIWIKNYVMLCNHIDFLVRDARLDSGSKRYVDIRRSPEAFIAPFDVEKVKGAIDEVRSQKSNPFQKASVGFEQFQKTPSQHGSKQWEKEPFGRGPGLHDSQQKNHRASQGASPQESRFGTGWTKAGKWGGDKQQPREYARSEERQPRVKQDEYSRNEEYDLEEPQSFSGRKNDWNKDNWNKNEDSDFIEEDFEQGKVPYTFRKPR
jgi:hypothetical protein